METPEKALFINVTKVVDPLNFSAQIGSERAFEEFATYEKNLAKVCDKEAVPATFDKVTIGFLGYIKLNTNNAWRRVEVVDINRENAEVDVLHIDYSIEDSCTANRLMSCVSANLPPMPSLSLLICKCSLANVQAISSSKKWVPRAVSLLSSHVLDKKCLVELVGYSGLMTILVDITVEVDGEHKRLSDVLIDSDLAVKDESVAIGVPMPVPTIASFPVMVEPAEPASPKLVPAMNVPFPSAANEESTLVAQMQNLDDRILSGNIEGLTPYPYDELYSQINRASLTSHSSESIGSKSSTRQRRSGPQHNREGGNKANAAHTRDGSKGAISGGDLSAVSAHKPSSALPSANGGGQGHSDHGRKTRKSRENSESDGANVDRRPQQHGARDNHKMQRHANSHSTRPTGSESRDSTARGGADQASLGGGMKLGIKQQNGGARNIATQERSNNNVSNEKVPNKQQMHDKRSDSISSSRLNEILGIIEQAYEQGTDAVVTTVLWLCNSDHGDDILSVVTTALLQSHLKHPKREETVLMLLTRILDLPNADKALCEGIQQIHRSLCEMAVVDKCQSASFIKLLASLYLTCDKINIVHNLILNLVEESAHFDKKKSNAAVEMKAALLKQFLSACGARMQANHPAILHRVIKEVKRRFCMPDTSRNLSDILFDVLAMDRSGWLSRQHSGGDDGAMAEQKKSVRDVAVQAAACLADCSTQASTPVAAAGISLPLQNSLTNNCGDFANSINSSSNLMVNDTPSYSADDFTVLETTLRGAPSNTSLGVDTMLSSSPFGPSSPRAVDAAPTASMSSLAQHLASQDLQRRPVDDASLHSHLQLPSKADTGGKHNSEAANSISWSPDRLTTARDVSHSQQALSNSPLSLSLPCNDENSFSMKLSPSKSTAAADVRFSSPLVSNNDSSKSSAANQAPWDGASQVCTNCGSSDHRLYTCPLKKQLFHD